MRQALPHRKLDAYRRALEGLGNLFARGVPPKEALKEALDKEVRFRPEPRQAGAKERARCARDSGVDLRDHTDHALELWRQGRFREAQRLLGVLDVLYEESAQIPREIVRALTGDAEAAVYNLIELSREPERSPQARINAVLALEELGELDAHLDAAFQLIFDLARIRDFRQAGRMAAQLARVLERLEEESQAAWGRPQAPAQASTCA